MWNKDSIQNLLSSNDKAVARAVLAIYSLQTEDEKSTEATRHTNSVGFNHSDARRGSYYAEYVNKTGRLTGRHLEIARSMMMKYHRQLSDIANEGSGARAIELKNEAAHIEAQAEAYAMARDGEAW
jgi:hypothetical protein